MNIVAIIEARMLSTRLPGKVMHKVQGKTFLEHMIYRISRSVYVDSVCVATSIHESCDPIVDLCKYLNVGVYRGSEEDVLDRVVKAGKFSNADIIVELCGDNPLIDPDIIDQVCELYLNSGAEFCSNAIKRVHPIGMDVKVFSQSVIEEVEKLTNDPDDREHVSLYVYENPKRYNIVHLPLSLKEKYINHRLTLDTKEDEKLIKIIFDELYPVTKDFRLKDILTLFDNNLKLDFINSNIKQKLVHKD
jgi:spore coat polysaccharide biosynthesis protein SpsF